MSAQNFKVRWHWHSDTEGVWEVVEAPHCGGLQEGTELTLVETPRAATKPAQPAAWVWKHKYSGKEGLYWQPPASYGIDMKSPLYEWTILYTHPQSA